MSNKNFVLQPNQLYVLADDVQILEIDELPSNIRQFVNHNNGDFIISRPNIRTPSKQVDKLAADLIKKFKIPTKIIDVIIAASRENCHDPEKLLDSAYPLLKSLRDSNILLPMDSELKQVISPMFKPGHMINNLRIIRSIQTQEDVDVYQAMSGNKKMVAFKIARNAEDFKTISSFEREKGILSYLDNKVNPQLCEYGTYKDKPYVATEWFFGANTHDISEEYRVIDLIGGRQKLLSVCIKIIRAFAHLHDLGVIHGDIHPRNILVNKEEQVILIDYGLARLEKEDELINNKLQRAGVAFFLDPEYARANRCKQTIPMPSKKSEQYALSSLIYLMATGTHYINFSIEKNEMLRQIEEDPPDPFHENNVKSWPELEHVLFKALSKDPDNRFPTLKILEEKLQTIYQNEFDHRIDKSSKAQTLNYNKSNNYVFFDDVIRHTKKLPDELNAGPIASVTFGAAGIAYSLCRLSCLKNDPELLSAADIFIHKAIFISDQYDAFFNKKLDLHPENVGQISFYYNIPGLHYVRAIICYALGDQFGLSSAIEDYVRSVKPPSDKIDLNLGMAGALHGCSLLIDMAPSNNALLDFGNSLYFKICNIIESLEDINDCNSFSDLGIAHGWAGILYSLLSWCKKVEIIPSFHINDRLEQLAHQAEPWKRGLRWKSYVEKSNQNFGTYTSSWCTGTAGFVYLWTLAYKLSGKKSFLELAEGASWHVWEDESDIGDLCCGLAGRSFSLLTFFKCSEDKIWLRRAAHLGKKASQAYDIGGDVRFSLFKGALGVFLLLEELNFPEKSLMPLFEI